MTPTEHRDQATQMLKDVETTEAPSEARVLTQSAIAHALLGLLEIQIGNLRASYGMARVKPTGRTEHGSD